MGKNKIQPVARNVLLIESNSNDSTLIDNCIKENFSSMNLVSYSDGELAFIYLLNTLISGIGSKPNLIILDIHLPKQNGLEILTKIKNNPNLKRIPVIVITGLPTNNDIKDVYDLQANCLIVKPIDSDELTNTIKAIENFWLNIVQLPMA